MKTASALCLGHELFFWWLVKSYANSSFYIFCHCHHNGSGMLCGLDAFVPETHGVLTNFAVAGIVAAAHCKAAVWRRSCVGMKKGRDPHQDRWLCLPVIVLVDFVSLLLDPEGPWEGKGGRSPIHSSWEGLPRAINERKKWEGSKIISSLKNKDK